MNVLKWELKKRISQFNWIMISFIALLGIIYLLPVPSELEFGSGLNTLLSFISMIITIGCAYIVFVYPTLSMIFDLRKKYCLLEKMHSIPFVVTGIIRTILNIISVLIGSGLFLLASDIMKKFHIDNARFLVLNLTIPYENLLFITAIFFPILALFSYLTIFSIPIVKKYTIGGAIILFGIVGGAIIFVSNFSSSIASITQCLAILIAFALSCWFYDNKYELTNL